MLVISYQKKWMVIGKHIQLAYCNIYSCWAQLFFQSVVSNQEGQISNNNYHDYRLVLD